MGSDSEDSIAHTGEAGKPLAERILQAFVSRKMLANDDYTASLATKTESELVRGGIYSETLRRATAGVEPTWLHRAKRLHDELGKCIYVASQAPSPEFFTESVSWAEL